MNLFTIKIITDICWLDINLEEIHLHRSEIMLHITPQIELIFKL